MAHGAAGVSRPGSDGQVDERDHRCRRDPRRPTRTNRCRRDSRLRLGERHDGRPDSAGHRRCASTAGVVRRARRETDLLDPINSVRHVDAVVLSGGSAYGLAAADGVMRWLEEHEPRRGDGGRRGADRARRGGLRPARRGLAVQADRGVRLRRRGERRAPRSRSAPSAPGPARASACSRAGSAPPSVTLDIGRHRRCDRGRQRRGRGRRHRHRVAVAGRPDRGVRAGSRRRPIRSRPMPTGTPSSARSTPRSPSSPPTRR